MVKSSKTILLIVDDESTVCRGISRMLKGSVDEVITAGTPTDAETILATKPITHLLCDHWLGPGFPQGLDLALKWKRAHHSIIRAVVLTGTDVVSKQKPAGLDGVVSKSIAPEELVKVLDL